ncbi:MAG: hypothetical protein FJY92_11660 [Candidatus Hydrogenedentes bacterium]|nr:hypothetical protein [Candidatus Hydrogenedentota bacterium]
MLAAVSCGTFGGKSDPVAPAQPSAPVSGADDREARLREAVDAYIQSTGQASNDATGKLQHKTPYYFKEYYLYSEGAAQASVDIQEIESRTVPYRASVKVAKQRFSTKLHRKRDEAAADSNYARDTGYETLSFEMRNGRWYRAGSMFVAEKTEEFVNGEWVPAQEEVERTVAAEEEQAGSWWERAWESVTGRSLERDDTPPPAKSKPSQGVQIGPSNRAQGR